MTSDQQLYCDGPGPCDRPVAGHGEGKCSTHLKQLQRTGKCTPIAEKLTPEERALVAGTAMLEADSDEEYAAQRRAWLNACKDLGGKAVAPELEKLQGKVAALEQALGNVADEMRRQRSEEVKRGLSAARARGVALGRPPKVSAAELIRLFEVLGNGSKIARIYNLHPATVNARIARLCGKRRNTSNPPTASSPRPRRGSS